MHDAYASILNAIEHARAAAGCKVKVEWIETSKIKGDESDAEMEKVLAGIDGIIVPGGFGARGTEGKIRCIKFAREHKLPYLGLCYGMQMAVVEFCRNVIIYFDKPTQADILSHLLQYLVPGGFLFLGHSESLNGTRLHVESMAPTIYRRGM